MSHCYLLDRKRNKGWEACECHTPARELNPGSVKRCGSCVHLGPRKKGEIAQARLDAEIYTKNPYD